MSLRAAAATLAGMSYLRRHHVGLLALFIALGGTSYAATQLPRYSPSSPAAARASRRVS
jgi:hypothetical protein